MNHNIRIGLWVVLIGSVIVGCTREPSRSVVTDDVTFNKDNRTQGKIEFVRVDPDGSVALKYQDNSEPITVRPSEYTTLSNRVKAVVIASDPELQTATIRVRMSKETKDR